MKLVICLGNPRRNKTHASHRERERERGQVLFEVKFTQISINTGQAAGIKTSVFSSSENRKIISKLKKLFIFLIVQF
jgi:hypothetical protein